MMAKGWRVDDMIVHRIVEDQQAELPPSLLFPEIDPALLALPGAGGTPSALDPVTGHLVMSFHAFVVRTPRQTVLIDSCIGKGKNLPMAATWHNRTDDRWMAEFHAAGLEVEDIDYVLCTHMHADHVGWNTTLVDGRWIPTFPNARHLMVDEEYIFTQEWLRAHAEDPSALARSRRSAWEESIKPVVEAGRAEFVAATHALGDYFRLTPTPGHTPGHVAVAAGRSRDSVVFTGDLIYSPLQLQDPGMRMILDADPVLAAHTRRDFLARHADTGTLVCTMHFPAPSVGRLRAASGRYIFDYVGPDA